MRAIMADNDIRGQFTILMVHLRSDEWREIWNSLNLSVLSFADLGLDDDVSDSVLWRSCQAQQIILLTGNRNEDGPDSLEATIRQFNTPISLPVFTLALPRKVVSSQAYAAKIAESLLQYLLDIDRIRGTGRLWLP